jgi:phage baseplate assembly protein W
MANERELAGPTGFLGVGWSFPPDFDAVRGTAVMSTNERDIEASLRILLGTTAGERVRHPTYGLNLQELLFEPMNTTMQTLLKDRIRTTVLIYEPRINVVSIELNPERLNEGCLEIVIEYVIRMTNSRFNLVLPFYVREATEVAGTGGVKDR